MSDSDARFLCFRSGARIFYVFKDEHGIVALLKKLLKAFEKEIVPIVFGLL